MIYKRNRTYEQKLEDALENKIGNLESHLKERIKTHMLALSAPILNVVKIKRYILDVFLDGGIENGRITRQYWIVRGWNQPEAIHRSKEEYKKHHHSSSPFTPEFWLHKQNLDTGELYNYDEACYKAKSQIPSQKEYWLNQGFDENTSIFKAANRKHENNKKGSAVQRDLSVIRASSKRCAEYWQLRGYNEDGARQKVSEHQVTFSLDKCIIKYGEKRGRKRWQKRQDKWLHTLNLKSDDEKRIINRKKVLLCGMSFAECEIVDYLTSILGSDVYHCFPLGSYLYDIEYHNAIIEYHGDYWHCNPIKYAPTYYNKRLHMNASEKWKEDAIKEEYAKQQGYRILVVWEQDYLTRKQEMLNICLQFLTNN